MAQSEKKFVFGFESGGMMLVGLEEKAKSNPEFQMGIQGCSKDVPVYSQRGGL